jgi:Dolichyl-phosphate-mannose-protein mannosyltransferase
LTWPPEAWNIDSPPIPAGKEPLLLNEAAAGAKQRANNLVLLSLAVATLAIHLICTGAYGYFRDELYYIACSKHLAWGYVDQPPFSELLLAINGRLLGFSLFSLRLLPAICAGLVAYLVGVIARELGGGRAAQVLAMLAYMVGGVFLAIGSYYSMNCFDHLFWALSVYVLVRILKYEETRLWILFGVIAGLGLENKYSMGFLGIGLIAGLALTPARRHFRDPWLWVGGAIAAAIFLPHVAWEVRNQFPTAEFIHNATFKKNLPMTPWAFLAQCALQVNPLTFPLWVAGLGYLFFSPRARQFRVLAWIYVAVLTLLLSTHSKPYYFAPAFLILLPAGGVAAEAWTGRHPWKWLIPAYAALLGLGGALLAPIGLPILPVGTYLRYQSWIGFKPEAEERGSQGKLPQTYADRFGWPQMAATVARVYNSLSPEERAQCVIGASNYGEAGALDFFGKQYGLPNAISSHNNYWIWGPGDKPGDVLLVVGGSLEGYEKMYNEVEQVATIKNEYAMPYETNLPVYLCRKPKVPLQQVWPRLKEFI